MRNLASLLIVLTATATAAEPPVPAAAIAPPTFNKSDEVSGLPGYDDANALYEVKLGGEPLTEEQQVARWLDELKGGRARAGALVGSHLAYLALTDADCAAARDALTRADELGSDQAAWKLAQLAENRTCGDVDLAARQRWLKKAVTLDYLIAAQELIVLYSSTESSPDPIQHYLYARVAAGYWESVYGDKGDPAVRALFDSVALQAMEQTLKPEDRKRAEADAAKILEQMLKRHARFIAPLPQEFSRGGRPPKASKGWGFAALTLDYHHECMWNLANNCRGAQRLAIVEVSNNTQDFMACKATLRTRDFVTGAAGDLSREVLVGPKVTRRLVLGDVSEQPDQKAMVVNCAAVPKLLADAAAGKCRARLQGTIDAQQFYPQSARNAGVEGDAVVRFWVPAGRDTLSDVEIARSSGYPELDAAAIDTIRSGHFTKECDYGLSSIRIAFKLQD